jgi:coenzyme PQQ biosynthesis protein C
VTELLSASEIEARLRQIGAERYHDRHPFHQLMNSGELTKGQLQAWALNRYYYQASIPMKDAAILSRMADPGSRRAWRQRLVDHDGDKGHEGGIARWLVLAEGLGLDRGYVTSTTGILPATRFAVEAYVHFVRERTLLEAVASSLTELFSPTTIRTRMTEMLRRYDYVTPQSLAYFEKRLTQAPRDVDFALDYVKREATDAARQQAVINALLFKCDVLWAMLDALYFAYVKPALPPPGSFAPEGAR